MHESICLFIQKSNALIQKKSHSIGEGLTLQNNMSSQVDVDAEGVTVGPSLTPFNGFESTVGSTMIVTIGATVPTGFEHTAAEEVKEKIGAEVRIGKDRGRIYFEVSTERLSQVG